MQAEPRLNDPILPQQFEKTDWRDAVQTYVSENPGARAIDIAGALGCTEAEALSALSDVVWKIPGADLSQVLSQIRAWGPVLVLVRNEDAVAEVEAPGDGGAVKGDWLNWIDEGYNLHIRIAATQHILALARPGKRGPTHSFNLVDRAGQVFCRFYARTPTARERFLAFCEAYTSKTSED